MKRADAICTAYAGATKPIVRPHSYAEVVDYVKQTLPLYEAALRKLEELRPPSRDAAAVRRWLAADRRVAQAFRSLGEAGERRDFPSVTEAVGRVELAGNESQRAATALGLHVCAQLARPG